MSNKKESCSKIPAIVNPFPGWSDPNESQSNPVEQSWNDEDVQSIPQNRQESLKIELPENFATETPPDAWWN